MTEKDFKKILCQGTTRQRVMLIANHLAEEDLTGEGLLTQEEFNALKDSIKGKDWQFYNLVKCVDRVLRNRLGDLEGLTSDYNQVLTAIDGLVLEYQFCQEQKELVNSLLELVRIKDRPVALRTIIDHVYFLNADIFFSKDECRVRIDTDRKVTKAKQPDILTLFDMLDIEKERGRNIVSKAKTIIQFCREMMEHNDIDIKPFKEQLKIRELYFKTAKSPPFYKVELVTKKNNYEQYKLLADYDSIDIDEQLYLKMKDWS